MTTPSNTDSQSFRDGVQAFNDGRLLDDNDYVEGEGQYDWHNWRYGWFAAGLAAESEWLEGGG
jgi:hypothetical protein